MDQDDTPKGYRVFSSEFDEVIDARTLVAEKPKQTHVGPSSPEIADQNLQNFVTSNKDMLKNLRQTTSEVIKTLSEDATQSNVALSLLIDHSGSMRDFGVNIAHEITICVAQLAEGLRIPYEVLGYTTLDWRGAPVRQLWQKMWLSPVHPGRLCSLRHIVYKDFSNHQPPDMTAMYLPDTLKENIDGEAIEWAAKRLLNQPKTDRILVYVADGAPVDDSTLKENDPDFLIQHLCEVLESLKANDDIRVLGVGVGHDLSNIVDQLCILEEHGQVEEALLPALFKLLSNTDRHLPTLN